MTPPPLPREIQTGLADLNTEEAVGRFVSSLWTPDRSLARRAYTAWFIRAHGDAIERYIRGRIERSGATREMTVWARKTRVLLRRNTRGPKGVFYNPRTGSLETPLALAPRSFRLSGTPRQSLTLPRRHPAVRVAGYLLGIATLIALMALGWLVRTAIERYGTGWIQRIEDQM